MVINENSITVAGLLGKDPHTIVKPSYTMTKLSIATSAKGKGDEYETTWHTATLWGKTAQEAQYWKKGDNVFVKGKRVNVQYTNKAGTEVKGDDINAFQAFRIDGGEQPKPAYTPTELPNFDLDDSPKLPSFDDENIPYLRKNNEHI